MALLIKSSNRVERLQQNLSQELGSRPLSNPLATEIIVVPSYAMARWLNLHIARQQGIAANISYPLPATWLWDIAANLIDGIPDQDPLQLESMCWKIFAVLPEFLSRAEFDSLRDYLVDDESGVKRWQLSDRIAGVFDRYQQYRPQMIRDWCKQNNDSWQAQIWQGLIQGLNGNHRVNILSHLIDQLGQESSSINLPERISLFAISSLPPLTIEVIQALASHTDITLYQHSPTDQYFADLKSPRSLSQLQLFNPQQAEYYEIGNALLASWGRQGQIMQELLLEHGRVPNSDIEFNHPPGNTSLLQSIQQNIFDLSTTPVNAQIDASISIHVCHSAMRECQVLHDQLLGILSGNPQLSTEDILVMVPEISRYAPYIEAVFGFEDSADRPYLPWNLSDISISDEHPLVQSFMQLLALPTSRFEYSEVMSLLEIVEIRKRFEIDEQALEDIRQLLEATRVRWGIDGAFKTALGLPATIENTWQQAQQRLFAGYALGEIDYWNDIAPLAQMDTGRAINISKFCKLFERLKYWRAKLGKSTGASDWISKLNLLIDDFYQNINPTEDRIQDIRNSIDALSLAGNCQITATLLRDWLQKQLATQRRQGRMFSGGITFCGMRPMRNLPFQVICLLGMNDNAYPRRSQQVDFDLMNQQRHLGDPSTGDEDRYLMLETLLSARHTLYISYSGRSLKDNSECQPSVLVQELLDFIDSQSSYETDDKKPSADLIQLHPMQPFSENNFIAPLFSFDTAWCEIARQINLDQKSSTEMQWPQQIIFPDQSEQTDIDLEQLHRFIRHPIKYFFNTQLKIYLSEADENINDEIFSLDRLSEWQIKTRLAGDLLKGQSDQNRILAAEGLLPHGSAASIALSNIRDQEREWFEQLSAYRETQKLPKSISLGLSDNLMLYGEVEHYYPGHGLMHYSASRLKGRHLLDFWLDHLSLCACEMLDDKDNSLLITIDQIVNLQKLERSQAKIYLLDYIDLFIEAQSHILPIFPDSSYAFAAETDPDKAMQKAAKAWYLYSTEYTRGDSLDPYIKLSLRNAEQNPLNQPVFSEYATRLYQALLQNRLQS